MNRRELIGLLGGAAAAPVFLQPLAARAQQNQRMRRIGVIVSFAEDDPDIQARIARFRQGIEKLGWVEGRNVIIDVRFAAGQADRYVTLVKQLIASQPDAILSHSTPVARVLHRETQTIPIVFVSVSDPIGEGLVASLARPGGNFTGFLQYEAGISGKWLSLLKEIAPNLSRVALLANPKTSPYEYFLRSAATAASSLNVELTFLRLETATDIERSINDFAQASGGGLLLPPDPLTTINRDRIIALAAQHRLPAVYALRVFVDAGGLMAYDIDQGEMMQGAATYVDRILRGAKPADLPVQAPTTYRTILNLKTAKALGLAVPNTLLVAADEVIE